MDSLNIYQRINKVMKKGLYLKKGSAGQGPGVQYDELIALLAPHLAEFGIVVTSEKAGDSSERRTITDKYVYVSSFNITYINIDKPDDRFSTLIESQAMDSGDKAPGKAITYATKTSLLKVFGIESGDKEESRAEVRDVNVVSPEQAQQVFNLLCDTNGNYTPRGQKVWGFFKFDQIKDIKIKQYEKIVEMCK